MNAAAQIVQVITTRNLCSPPQIVPGRATSNSPQTLTSASNSSTHRAMVIVRLVLSKVNFLMGLCFQITIDQLERGLRGPISYRKVTGLALFSTCLWKSHFDTFGGKIVPRNGPGTRTKWLDFSDRPVELPPQLPEIQSCCAFRRKTASRRCRH